MAREIDKTAQDLAALQGLGSGEALEIEPASGSGLDAATDTSLLADVRRAVGADPAQGATAAQLREWKEHLASQAELLRRDGKKLLAREKQAREEREKIREARAAVQEQNRQLQLLERQLTTEREAHHARETKYQTLATQCDHWRREVAQAQAALAEITRRQTEGTPQDPQTPQAQPTPTLQQQRALEQREHEQRELIERLEGRVGELLGAMERKEREVGATAALVAQLQRELDQTRGTMEQAREQAQRVPAGGGGELALAGNETSPEPGRQLYALQRQLGEMQQQRDAAKAKLGDLLEHVRRQEDGSLTQRRTTETELAELRTKCDRLLKEKDSWEKERAEGQQAAGHAETQKPLDEPPSPDERAELLCQRAELDANAAQLEQMQRALEKHELDWDRQLSVHSAIKTVAAVGIFMLLAAAAAFAGAYTYLRPLYLAEATVQVAMGPGGERALNTFLSRSSQGLRDNRPVVEGAWVKMRQRGYADDNTREVWENSLAPKDAAPTRLTFRGDQAGRTLTLRYTAPTAAGAATAANALAESLAEDHTSTERLGIGTVRVAAPSVPPLRPMEDPRLIVGLESTAALVAAGALLAALLAWRKHQHHIE